MSEIRIYYRSSTRKPILLLGYFTNNGAKHAKMTVIHDYLGRYSKGEKIKVPLDGVVYHVRIHKQELQAWTETKTDRIEAFMHRKMNRYFKQKVGQLLGSFSS
ncbi:hypothetical protein [Paenibacillus glucanolyticus]|uniref:hypothetical protein n=1 Tax=Paenibacillus glucanolyticus TaxID=59843 RepID=UPI0034CE9194